MQTKILQIEGMMCEACVGHVTQALQRLSGVRSAEVSLSDKQAHVVFDPAQTQLAQMAEAVAEEGYAVAAHD